MNKNNLSIAVIGGGAAGFFTAINIKEKNSSYSVDIFEKGSKLLQKVKVSGGGRCNVTNDRSEASELVKFYPRGEKKLYKSFQQFGTKEMRQWLSEHNVPTVAEHDQRVFPKSNSSQSIIDCFIDQTKKLSIGIVPNAPLIELDKRNEKWELKFKGDELKTYDRVIIATGSSEATWSIFDPLGIKMTPRAPSLFTFNIKDDRIADLAGMVFPQAIVRITKTKLQESGPLLFTHWGMSGPVILKLSSWGARELAEKAYRFNVIINFSGKSFDDFGNELRAIKGQNPTKKLKNIRIEDIPKRYWERLLRLQQIGDKPIGELSKKEMNKLIEELTQAVFEVSGKSTFKDEFVTCGGIDLSEINFQSMEAKRFPGLYFAGEVIDIDALTGGFNFQACWTAGWLISEHLTTELS
ncbi:MAG: NAD(P)/FAD-dependent oxidoreductase [Cyclobacteriaceae bacterium]